MTMTAYAESAHVSLIDFANGNDIDSRGAQQKTAPDDKALLEVTTITLDRHADWQALRIQHNDIPIVKMSALVDKILVLYVGENSGEAGSYIDKEDGRFFTMVPSSRIGNVYRSALNVYRSALNEIAALFVRGLATQKSLANALTELEELDDYAAENELTPPAPAAKKFAREILGVLAARAPRHYSVSLWEGGDVIVYSGNTEWRVSIYCRADGGAACYVSSPNNHDRDSAYQRAQDMPVDRIIDELNLIPA